MAPVLVTHRLLFFSATILIIAAHIKVLAKSQNHRATSSLLFPVQGDILRDGAFYTTMNIGNPQRPYRLDIDTGSDMTWVQCNPGSATKLLKAPNAPYKPKNNVMLCKDPLCPFINQPTDYPCNKPNDQCDYEVQYADHGSSLGVVVRDAFSLVFANGSTYRPTLAFGCGYDQEFTGASAPFVDGVLGLANGKSSILSQLIDFGVTKNIIGHCLGRQGKGFLFIGDYLLPSGIVWAPLIPNSHNGYLLGPVDLLFGGKVSSVKGINVIFDSGSTYTYLNAQVYQATLSLIKSGLARKPLSTTSDTSLSVCWKGSKPFKSVDEVKGYFSPLALSFSQAKNVAFQIPPEAYLLITSHGNVCLGILNGADEKLGNLNIIGDISLLDKLVVYDNERHRIGWAPWNCDKVLKY